MKTALILFRQDPARLALVRSVLTSLLAAVVFRIEPDIARGLATLESDALPGGFHLMYLVLILFITVMMLSGNTWTRSSRMALALPVNARTAWAVRMLSLVAVSLSSILILAVVLGLSIDPESGSISVNPVILLAAARAAATSVLLLALFQLPLSAQARIPITAPYVVYVAFIGLLTMVFSSAAVTSLAGTLVLLLLAVALGAWSAHMVPSSYSIGPTVEESASPVWLTSEDLEPVDHIGWQDGYSGSGARRALHTAVFRAFKNNLLAWLLLLISGAAAGVVVAEFLDGTNAFMAVILVMFYTLPTLQSSIESARPFDSLPIPRWTLWAHAVGPIVVTAFAGAAIAILAFSLNSEAFSQVRIEQGKVELPWEYMELTNDGEAPVITAPWGESHSPAVHYFWGGRNLAFFNPYETAPEASERFLEFQTERAVAGVYGADHLGEHRTSAPGSAAALDAIRGRIPDERLRTGATALLCLSLVGAAILLQYLLYYGRWTRRHLFRWSALGTLVTLGAMVVLLAAAQAAGLTRLWYGGVLVSVGLHRLAQWLPFSTGALWLICVTFWVGAYLLIGRVFATIEFPREKTMNRFAEEY